MNSYTNTSIYGVDNRGSGLVHLVGSVAPRMLYMTAQVSKQVPSGFTTQGQLQQRQASVGSYTLSSGNFSDFAFLNAT